jgi:hypothetical protein
VKAAVAHSRTGLGEWTVQVEFTEKRVSRKARKERQGNGKSGQAAGEWKNQNVECKNDNANRKRGRAVWLDTEGMRLVRVLAGGEGRGVKDDRRAGESA